MWISDAIYIQRAKCSSELSTWNLKRTFFLARYISSIHTCICVQCLFNFFLLQTTQTSSDTSIPTKTPTTNGEVAPEEMTSKDYYFDSYGHFGIHEVCSIIITCTCLVIIKNVNQLFMSWCYLHHIKTKICIFTNAKFVWLYYGMDLSSSIWRCRNKWNQQEIINIKMFVSFPHLFFPL